MEKRLYRSDENKVLCGVCGGLGEYFNIDPTIVRLLWAILVFSGPGIFAYIVAAIIMPRRRY
ncbi:PspC domain-containing protein [Lachnoclostridium sp. An14]|uniref:PspC domain-containing protein n=1 Tax=Lachnoclostridium sp. An14 TaxID=1965562 RepID=UPI000B39160A|nr:PspC domain-containing protein [Lachnoclostridium sp. An14]OUQ15888.1 PspC domain-containing protein [Lachnoclostridium sp. An14]